MTFQAWRQIVLHNIEVLNGLSEFGIAKHRRHKEQLFREWLETSLKTRRINLGCQRLLWTWERRDRYAENVMSSLKGSTMSVSALCDRWKQSSTPHQDRKALVGEVKRQLDYVLLMLNFAF